MGATRDAKAQLAIKWDDFNDLPRRRAVGRISCLELEAIQADPQVRFGPPLFLDVETAAVPRSGNRSRPPEGRSLQKLLTEFLAGPDLPRVDVWLDTGREKNGVPATDTRQAVTDPRPNVHRAIVQRNAKPRLPTTGCQRSSIGSRRKPASTTKRPRVTTVASRPQPTPRSRSLP